MEPTNVLPILAVIGLIGVESGGYALLGFLTGRQKEQLGPFQEQFFRAGHGHAGVLLILALVYYLYLPRADWSDGMEWLAGLVLLVGLLAQPGGFFLHMARGGPGESSLGTTMTRVGGLFIGAALAILAVGLIQTA